MALVTFHINYRTESGQQVYLCGSLKQLGELDESKALKLFGQDDEWSAEIYVAGDREIQYYYLIRDAGATVRREWGTHRKVRVLDAERRFVIRDYWKERPRHSYLYSSFFSNNIFYHKSGALPEKYFDRSLLLNLICPYVRSDHILCIAGESVELGEWDLSKAKELTYVGNGEWQIVLDADRLGERSCYKFVIVDKADRGAVKWEDGENRLLSVMKGGGEEIVFVEMALLFRYSDFGYKGVGTAIPLFSLRTEESFGIGDFADLKKMVDWVALTRQQLIQLLPVNDTTATKTWRDSYPYNAISAFALHPIYLGCSDFNLKDRSRQSYYIKEGSRLNSLPAVDYEAVLKLKSEYSRELFSESGREILLSEEYQHFYKKNRYWLFPYACYSVLRDRCGNANFREWGEFSRYDEPRLKRMLKLYPEAKEESDYCCFVQFLLHKQFSDAVSWARRKGVALKGDIPIGINRNSVDAWVNPQLFNMEQQTGAPPDDFAAYGQNWGFPTYNWQEMRRDGYSWWKSRFRKMADYFDAYRTDHILGFFRIWEIPINALQGLLGRFNPAMPYSVEEIAEAGLQFDEERMAKPYICDEFLGEIFGEYVDEVKNFYLDNIEPARFKLKSFCDTQQKIEQLFAGKIDKKSISMKEGLLLLSADLLFIRDSADQNLYHPRIKAEQTYSYRYLSSSAKEAYSRLYNQFFWHRHNLFWQDEAMKKLPALISSTKMMACGEDLGMVPDSVPSVMNNLQILSLRIERMPHSGDSLFADLQSLPYLSVCTTSTHDMSPIRLWWREDRKLTEYYYERVLNHRGMAPEECGPELSLEIIERHLKSSSMLVILPLQEWLSIDEDLLNPDLEAEQINIPADPDHYWRYRMHISLDDLLIMSDFNNRIKTLADR